MVRPWFYFAAIASVVSTVFACSGTPAAVTAGVIPAKPLSFKQDVAPLLAQTCNGCHTPGGDGSNDFVLFDANGAVSYDNLKGEIDKVVRQVQSGAMPRGRAHLTADQIGTLQGWQQQGAANN